VSHYEVRPTWMAAHKLFRLDEEDRLALYWIAVRRDADAAAWLLTPTGTLGTLHAKLCKGDPRARPLRVVLRCADCGKQHVTLDTSAPLCFACSIAVRPGLKHRGPRALECISDSGRHRIVRGYCYHCGFREGTTWRPGEVPGPGA
jgi:hypothetical protein